MTFKEARKKFEKMSEKQAMSFWYQWFGEEWLVDMSKEGIENNPEEFIKLVEIVCKNVRR